MRKEKDMNKGELIAAVAKKAGLKNTEATKAVEAFLDSVVKTVAKGQDARLVGFGTFSVTKRAARQGRNPRTGAPLKLQLGKPQDSSLAKNLKRRYPNITSLVKFTLRSLHIAYTVQT